MPFQVITMKNKSFWSRVITALAGFAMVITAMAIVFPLHSASDTAQVDSAISTTTTTEQQVEEV